MELCFLRHGVTEANRHYRHHHHHTPLAKEGIRQAEELAHTLHNTLQNTHSGTVRLYSSTATRALETASVISRTTGVPIIEKENLREEARPSMLAGLSYFHPYSLFTLATLGLTGAFKNYHFADEENPFEFRVRAERALSEILSDMKEDDRAIVITHNAMLRELREVLLKKSLNPLFERPLAVLCSVPNATGFRAIKMKKQNDVPRDPRKTEWSVTHFCADCPQHRSEGRRT